ncbi:DUF5009 domain-containing protein [Marinilabiliaceae bacterium JC017]|nr:DUF5009 domain-containing protein [Marinilabiliaceae bacterium JC017]
MNDDKLKHPGAKSRSNRIVSLDMMRGLTIAAMILVSNPGSWSYVYHPLTHTPWHHITPTDLIFPFFIFIVGVSIVLALKKRLQGGTARRGIYRKIFTRSLILMGLGIFLNLFPAFNFSGYGWAGVGYTGVLSRISIVYLVCALLFLNTTWKTQAIIGGTILLLYWVCMCFVPIPGIGTGIIEPGNNMAAWIDTFVLSIEPGQWVPEGFFSTFPAIVTGITGMLTGQLLLSGKEQSQQINWMMTAGFIAVVLGTVWGWQFPVNKNIWSSSFVLVSSGMALLTLAVLIFFIDAQGFKRGSHFGIVFGANAIAIYLLSHLIQPLITNMPLVDGQTINGWFMTTFTGMGVAPKLVSMVFAILYVLLCFIPASVMYKKKLFIKV